MGVSGAEPTRSVVLAFSLAALADAAACASPAAPAGAVWTFRTPRPWLAGTSQAVTPIVDGDSVYFCGGYSVEEDAAVHALALADGRPRWRQPVGRCRSLLATAGGPLIVVSSRGPGAQCVIEGYDPKDGSTRWRHAQESRACARFTAAAGGVVLFTDEQHNQIVTLRGSDGRLQRFELGRSADGKGRPWLTASGSTAWFGVDDRGWRWNPDEEDEPRRAFELSELAGAPDEAAVAPGLLVLGDRRPGRLRGFDLESGTMLWQQSGFPQVLSLAVVGRELYANIWRRRFELVAIDAKSGIERWRAPEGGFLPPTLAGEGLLAGNGEFSVFVADATNGRIVRTVESRDEVITSPVHGRDDLFLFGTISGALHAVRVPAVER